MFKSLFKPKWQSAKPQVRIQAIELLDAKASEDARIIELLARQDIDPSVRAAAVKRLPEQNKLLDLVTKEKEPQVRQAAIEQFSSLWSSHEQHPSDPALQKMLSQLDKDALTAILQHTQDLTIGAAAIDIINDESVLETLVNQLPLAQLRQAAAQKLETESVLERVVKLSKGKDKGVWRICKDRLNALREAQQQEASIEQQIGDLCHNLETMARSSYDNLYVAKVEHLQKQWQRLQHHADNEAIQRFNRAFALCKGTMDDINNEQNRLVEETKQRRDAMQERIAACEHLEDALKDVSQVGAKIDASDVPALHGLLNTQKNRWDEASSLVPAAPDERKRFTRVYSLLERSLEAIRELNNREPAIVRAAGDILKLEDPTTNSLQTQRKKLQQAFGDLKWPDELPWPECLKQYQLAKEHLERLGSKAKAMEEEAIANIKGLMEELANEINLGHLKPSIRLLKEIQPLIKHLPQKAASSYQRQLRELNAQVNELRDWQGFAATPKKEQLCHEMEALVGETEDPQALATKIQRLQEAWREVGEADRGRDKELWLRFKAAADKAYEPCKQYFDQLATVRKDNLARRKQVCEQLTLYLQQYDWENPNWTAVMEVYDTAKNEWRLYSPVERKAGKTVQDTFNGLLDQLRDKIQGEFNRNKLQREQLIAAVEALITAEGDLNSIINDAKQLQQQWRKTGVVARRDDAKLWKRFRAACDQVFERRDQQRAEQAKEREQNFVHGEHLCEQIEQLAESHFSDLRTAEQEFKTLQRRFDELRNVPKEQQNELQRRYREVCRQFENTFAEVEQKAQRQSFQEMWRRAALCDELEARLFVDEEDSSAEPLEWDADSDLPEDVANALQQRFDQVQQMLAEQRLPDAEDVQLAGEQLRDLCIRLEIVAGVDSPAGDRERRMNLQVDRLSDGLSQRGDTQSKEDAMVQLQKQWCTTGPVDTHLRETLSPRFQAVLKDCLGSH